MIDFSSTNETLRSCIHLNEYDNLEFPTYSREFHDYLEKLNNRTELYGAYICRKCDLPDPSNVMWCWPCQSYFYGTSRSKSCEECKEYM